MTMNELIINNINKSLKFINGYFLTEGGINFVTKPKLILDDVDIGVNNELYQLLIFIEMEFEVFSSFELLDEIPNVTKKIEKILKNISFDNTGKVVSRSINYANFKGTDVKKLIYNNEKDTVELTFYCLYE